MLVDHEPLHLFPVAYLALDGLSPGKPCVIHVTAHATYERSVWRSHESPGSQARCRWSCR